MRRESIMGNIRNKAISGLLWKLLEQNGVIVIQFVLQIILARILMPKVYGVVAIASVFITFSNIFVQNGFSTALVQKKEVDDKDLSSVLFFSLATSTILYLLIFLIAPIVSRFFNMPELKSVIRALSLILFLGAFNSVQLAIVRRKMQFRINFLASSIAVIISGSIAVVLAYKGFGVWALVVQQIMYYIVVSIVLSRLVRWKIKAIISINSLRELFSFGWKVLVLGLVDELFAEFRTLVIGKQFSSSMLAYYNRGKQFPNIFVKSTNGAIQAVLLPVMAQQQENVVAVKSMTRRAIKTGSFVVFPMMMGLAVIAEPLVSILLTDKWLPCVFYLQIHCFIYALWPITTTNQQALYALGRSGLVLRSEVIRKCLDLVILFISMQYGVKGIALGAALVAFVSLFVYIYPNTHVLQYRIIEQLRDVSSPFLLSLVMGSGVYTVRLLQLSTVKTLMIQVVLGIILYFGLAKLFRMESMEYILDTIKSWNKREA